MRPYFNRLLQRAAIAMFLFSSVKAGAMATELPPWRWKQGHWKLAVQSQYFYSDSNYDNSRGLYESLPGGNNYQLMEFGLRVRYNAFRWLSVYVGGDLARATSHDPANAIGTSPVIDREKTAFTDAIVGADVLLMQKWFRLVAEIEGSYSFDAIDVDTTDVLTNDGVSYGKALVFAYKPFSWFNTYAHGGIKYRDEGLSALFTWGAGLEKPAFKRFLFGAGVEGYETLIADELNRMDRETLTRRVNANSHAFYAHDPAIIEARAWVGWNPVDAWQFRVGYGQSLDGIRSAAGQTVFLNLSYDFNPKPDRESFQYYKVRRDNIRIKNRKAVKNFEVEPEKTDPTLFDDDDGFEPDTETDPLGETERLLDKR